MPLVIIILIVVCITLALVLYIKKKQTYNVEITHTGMANAIGDNIDIASDDNDVTNDDIDATSDDNDATSDDNDAISGGNNETDAINTNRSESPEDHLKVDQPKRTVAPIENTLYQLSSYT